LLPPWRRRTLRRRTGRRSGGRRRALRCRCSPPVAGPPDLRGQARRPDPWTTWPSARTSAAGWRLPTHHDRQMRRY
jgi:hypothetical protein